MISKAPLNICTRPKQMLTAVLTSCYEITKYKNFCEKNSVICSASGSIEKTETINWRIIMVAPFTVFLSSNYCLFTICSITIHLTMCYNFQKHCTRTNETSAYVFVFNISLFRNWIRERVKGSRRGGMVVEEIVVEGTIV